MIETERKGYRVGRYAGGLIIIVSGQYLIITNENHPDTTRNTEQEYKTDLATIPNSLRV